MPGWTRKGEVSGLRVAPVGMRRAGKIFTTMEAARRSLLLDGGTAEYSGKHVTVTTPIGLGKFSAEEWERNA